MISIPVFVVFLADLSQFLYIFLLKLHCLRELCNKDMLSLKSLRKHKNGKLYIHDMKQCFKVDA